MTNYRPMLMADPRYEDEERGPIGGLIALVALLIGWIARLIVVAGFIWAVSLVLLRQFRDVLPDWLVGVLDAIVGFFSGVSCSLFGLFCLADTPLDATPPSPPIVAEAPVAPPEPVCAAGEIIRDSACVCDEGLERDAAGLCVAPPPPAPEPEAEPEPAPVPAPPVFETDARSLGGAGGAWPYAKTAFATAPLAGLDRAGACRSAALVAIGAASADNDTGRNDELAGRRAFNLAKLVSEWCGAEAPPVWRANLGGYQAAQDRAAQRVPMLAIIRSDQVGAEPSRAQVERSLCNIALPLAAGVSIDRYAAYALDNVCQNGWGRRLEGPRL